MPRGRSWILLLLPFCLSCLRRSATGPAETGGFVSGFVRNAARAAVHPAFVTAGDTLLAATDDQGRYAFALKADGPVLLTCSALNYRDTTAQIQVAGGRTVSADFTLTANLAAGKVYGEFEDNALFAESIITHPSIRDWDPQQVFDGTTGATIQGKTYGHEVPERRVFLGDSLVAYGDSWGQFWFKVPCGTYPLRGTCEGFSDALRVVRVAPDADAYVNFFLTPKTAPSSK
jgi:hypothetical protein